MEVTPRRHPHRRCQSLQIAVDTRPAGLLVVEEGAEIYGEQIIVLLTEPAT